MMKNERTKRVAGIDLSPRCFAFVGDPDETSTWKLPIHFPGDAAKTINFVRDALGRFEQTQGIPNEQREKVWHTVRGAALCLGLKVNEPAAPRIEGQPSVEKLVAEKPLKRDKRVDAIFADADRRATAFLKSIGFD